MSFIFAAFWNFWRIIRLSTTNHRWVINAQTGPFFGRLSVDNSAMVSGSKTCDTSKVSECCKNKRQICILKHLNICCLICINKLIRHPRNFAKFDCNLTAFILSFYNLAMFIDERRVICQKFQNCVQKKCTVCTSQHLNIFCLIYANLSHP